jgi:hypothetical protein
MVRPEMMQTFKDRIKERPYSLSWEDTWQNTHSISEKGLLIMKGLMTMKKFCLYVHAWNLSDSNPFRRTVMKNFEWSLYKTRKLASELIKSGLIESQATFRESDMMLCGRGYWYTGKFKINNDHGADIKM